MIVTKILLIVSLLIAIAWAISSKFDFEPIVVIFGLIINFIALTVENKVQTNKLKFSRESKVRKVNQQNKGGDNQSNDLELDGDFEEVNQINS